MANLPTRTTADVAADHVADHNTLHAFHNLIDAAGDLIVGTGADTAGKLAKGAAETVLRVNAAGTALEYFDSNAAYVKRDEINFATQNAAETTTSAVFTDLATVGPAVTVTIGASGNALVIIGGNAAHNVVDGEAYIGVAVSGATVVAASQLQSFAVRSAVANQRIQGSRVYELTGLTPGANTFTAKYRLDNGAGTATFSFRTLQVIPI